MHHHFGHDLYAIKTMLCAIKYCSLTKFKSGRNFPNTTFPLKQENKRFQSYMNREVLQKYKISTLQAQLRHLIVSMIIFFLRLSAYDVGTCFENLTLQVLL
jgi:hypothetical protein